MRVVYKYPFPVQDEFTLNLPKDSSILHVECQMENDFGVPCMWVLVNKERLEDTVPVKFHLFGTGHPIDKIEDLVFVKSFLMMGGKLVWHLFVESEFTEPDELEG